MTQFDKIAMTIAGSDSGGGAGIQADLRTFAFHCVHGTSAITCVTAQNTVGVDRVVPIAPEAVVAQIEAVAEDISIGATKTGMLFDREIILAVARSIQKLNLKPLVVDPVMVSRAGATLLDDRAITSLQKDLIPLATIVTPNLYEAQILSNLSIKNLEDMQAAAKKIYQQGAAAVLIKGGAMLDDLRGVDVFFDGGDFTVLCTETVDTVHTHGTGCSLSAAIAANLSLGKDLLRSVEAAKNYVTTALKYSLNIGRGTGPIGHFFPLLEKD
ncbi:MAG: bifunctional hydroxymethylpyrimidine kinase/phosphomethylpyrimidine kinase [Prochloraceae cyanobacterium]